MRKLVILLFILLSFSCSKQEQGDFVLMANGIKENYLIIVDSETCVSIKFDNREIDKDKILAILKLKPDLQFNIDKESEKSIVEAINEYREDERTLLQVFVNNKKRLEERVNYIFSNSLDLDIKGFTDKINKQKVYYFDDIEQIKDSANNLAKWLDQVKKLSTRKDL